MPNSALNVQRSPAPSTILSKKSSLNAWHERCIFVCICRTRRTDGRANFMRASEQPREQQVTLGQPGKRVTICREATSRTRCG
jgi:hypothetical protein